MTKLVLDPDKSQIRIRTFAEGLFARLAHDLELVCRGVSGSAERIGDDKGSASLEVAIAKIEVSGALKNDRVDARILSPSDREDILGKMRKDVFHAQGKDETVRVEATLDAGTARVKIMPPHGRTVERSVSVRLAAAEDAVRASGSLDVSLSAIGSDPVKGPMNAFRVKDNIEVLFDVVFKPSPA